jgi:hypothetical protein
MLIIIIKLLLYRVNIRISNAMTQKKLFLWSHDFEKFNFKMTACPLTHNVCKTVRLSEELLVDDDFCGRLDKIDPLCIF